MKQWMAHAAWLAPLVMTLGCRDARPNPPGEQPSATVELPSDFDPTSAGTIRGTVTWAGSMPVVPPFEIKSLITPDNPPRPRLVRENPNAPAIDAKIGAVAGAVVFLRKVDPRKARPWDLPPVTIEHDDRRLFVVQGDAKTRIGFVRQGGAITMVSRENVFNALHAGGASYFSLMFPEPNQPLKRQLKDKGIVELTSAAGYYWMRVYLFVDVHPYFVRTDAQGAYELRQVPPGRYQIVCWMPNWNKKTEDRDPESGLVTRMSFDPPLQVEREVALDAGGEARVDFSIGQ